MDSAEDKSLFDISLSAEGASYVLRTYKLIWIVFIAILLISIFTTTRAWLDYFRFSKIETRGNALVVFQFKVYPYFASFLNLLLLIQNCLYLNFYLNCKRSIEIRQPELFNRSFRWLLMSTKIAAIGVVIDLAASIFYLYYSLAGI